jgi:hypothetical protein
MKPAEKRSYSGCKVCTTAWSPLFITRPWAVIGILREIRSELQVTQREVKATNPNLDKLFGRLEGLAGSVEQEIDLARRDESRDRNRRSGGD